MILVGVTSVNQIQIDQFVDETGITYPILQDQSSGGTGPGGFGGVTYDEYYIPNQGSPYPRDFIVDQNGLLVYANNEVDTEYMLYILDVLLAGEDLSVSKNNIIPNRMKLFHAYPNPFNPFTNIRFNISKPGPVRIGIFNSNGHFVTELLNKTLSPGYRELQWNGSAKASGVYFVKLESGSYSQVQKIILLK